MNIRHSIGHLVTIRGCAAPVHGTAEKLSTLSYDGYNEPRQYNSLGQLTQMAVPGMMDIMYVYPAAGQSNGRIAQSVDAISGEQVTYQ